MNRMRATLTVCVAAGMLGIGCGTTTSPAPPPAPPPPPPPGSAVVSLTTPNTDDGAVTVSIRGPGLSSLQVVGGGNLLYTRTASDSEARVIIIGNVSGGALFSFKPAGGAALTAYNGTVTQVATRGDSLRSSVQGYQVTVTAAP